MGKYISFEDSAKSLVEISPLVMRENATDEVLQLFIEHNYIQVRKALDGDYFDERFVELSRAVEEAKQAVKSKKAAWVSMAMMRLGMAVGRMNRPTELEMMKVEISEIKAKRQSRSIDTRNAIYQALSEYAMACAVINWHKDEHKKIRITEMADQYVTPELHKYINEFGLSEDYLPDTATIKKYIKPVAPEYAQKRGRPKKK